MKYTDKQILDRVSKLPSFKGFPEGYWDVWVRSSSDKFNSFDDKVYTFKKDKFIMVCSGTSNPGKNGLINFDKYNPLGAAILKSDIIVYDSHILGKHKGKYPAYVQSFTVAFPYYRDGNKNTKAEEIGKIYTNRIGANCHKAGVNSVEINGWSLGCLVRNKESDFNKWMSTLNGQKTLTVCILKEF